MKAERRHELDHNELDSFLVQALRFLRENGALLGISVGVVLLAVALYFGLFAEKSMTASAGLWQKYFEALSDQDAEAELEKLVDAQEKSHGSEAPVLWARLSLGNLKLAQGTRDLFQDRTVALESLDEAEKHFLAVDKHAERNVEVRDRARLGLAEVYESQSKPEEAIKYYHMVAKASPDSALGKVAARGEQRLSQKSNQEFLTWFAQQKPVRKPAGKSQFDFGAPPEAPNFSLPPLEGSGDKPITPGFKIPSKLPNAESDPPADPAATPPSEGDAKSDSDPKPVDPAPADDKPADDKPE